MTTTAPEVRKPHTRRGIAGRKIAYLLSCYPAVSHTFFLNEICELRKLGFTIDVASINKPDWPAGAVPERDFSEMKATFYIKSMKRTRVAVLLATILVARPLVLLRGLRAALALDPWSLEASGYALFYLAEALILGDHLRRRGHRHLHVHFGGPVATVGMLASIAWGIPYSLTVHGPDEFYDVARSYLPRKVERAKFIFCISDYCRSQIMKIADPSHWSKIQVLRLGVDPELFAPDSTPKTSSVTEIVCVGRLVPAKGHLILLQAVAALARRGYPLRLRLIGEGVDRPRLEAFTREHGLDSSVVFEGALSHAATRKLLSQADIFALASFAEGVPVALMEAMAMEIPCVSTSVAGIPELIRDGLDGLLVPPSSEIALANALECLISDPARRRSLAAAGRRRVLDLYNLQPNARALADALDHLVPEPA